MDLLLIAAFVAFTLWLGSKILVKAGIHKAWVLCLLIPVINIIMIWVFAFSYWPTLKKDVKQDL
jgi:predicted PurR-regulated permease PerM